METAAWILALFALAAAGVFFALWQTAQKRGETLSSENHTLETQLNSTKAEKDALLQKYGIIIDVEEEVKKIRADLSAEESAVQQKIDAAENQARQIISEAEANAKSTISEAETKASEARSQMAAYEKATNAFKRTIEGYGDEWLKPAYSLLDDLAESFGFTEAGQKLKEARATSAKMVKEGQAAECKYAVVSRRTTATQFVTDAFNGKVDSILSKVKKDNYGILEQKIRDAFEIVNINGSAFREAKITEEYLNARLDELKWAVIVQEFRSKAAEEQRALREKMREEEKARKEFERAQKEAAKEEEMIKKAMEKAQEMLAKASEAQKAKYEAQLQELEEKLNTAEEKGQRALSMAQQTKKGTVYIISNIGSFGENVYKVGMTRRLDPLDRVRELGDASVPFPFDVHAFIESDDAPALESQLHKDLSIMRLNKVNSKKEFFRVDLATIQKIVDSQKLNVHWTLVAAAEQYRETLAINKRIQEDPAERARWESFTEVALENGYDEEE